MTKNIVLFKVHMPEEVKGPLVETIMSGYIGQGPKVEQFESMLAEYIGNPYAVTVNSGTAGLQLALRLANVGYGDEVITTPMTCTATNMPILAAGAKIVWADIDPVTGNIDPKDIERKITPRTKALMAVHWGGYPCDMEEINAIAKKHKLKVIEDGAHSFGAEYKGKKIGTHSDFVMFSFQAIKHITTVDGGAVFCKNKDDYQRAKLLRWFGIDREGARKDFRCEEDIKEWGYKFHMNDISAVVGIAQMPHIDRIVTSQRDNAAFYDRELSKINGVKVIPWASDRRSAVWLYTFHIQNRDEYRKFMHENGVAVSQVHARNDTHTCFAPYQSTTIPNVDKFVSSMICIPVGWWVNQEDRQYIVDKTREFSQKFL